MSFIFPSLCINTKNAIVFFQKTFVHTYAPVPTSDRKQTQTAILDLSYFNSHYYQMTVTKTIDNAFKM